MKLQKLYRYVRQAADEYNLIEDGDKIAVAVSGGKDSLALLYALAGLKRFYPASFTICAITIDIGFGMDFTPVQRLCDELDVPFFIIGFSLLNCLEFFVFRKMKSSSTINHPLCGCESNVIQKKLPFRVQ